MKLQATPKPAMNDAAEWRLQITVDAVTYPTRLPTRAELAEHAARLNRDEGLTLDEARRVLALLFSGDGITTAPPDVWAWSDVVTHAAFAVVDEYFARFIAEWDARHAPPPPCGSRPMRRAYRAATRSN